MDIEIATNDLGKMSWYEAVGYCNANIGWRLPTKVEMNWIYKNYFKKGLGNFSNTYYWTIDELSSQYAWSQNFDTGVLHYYTKMHRNKIRLIKNK